MRSAAEDKREFRRLIIGRCGVLRHAYNEDATVSALVLWHDAESSTDWRTALLGSAVLPDVDGGVIGGFFVVE